LTISAVRGIRYDLAASNSPLHQRSLLENIRGDCFIFRKYGPIEQTPIRTSAMADLKAKTRLPYFFTASAIVLVFAALLIWLAFVLLRPTPPRFVTMSTDPEGSFNAELARRYRQFFARNGIDLKLVPSAGAVESVSRLQDRKSGVSIAILPGGITTQQDSPDLVSLGTLFYEPLWLFVRGRHLQTNEQMKGLRISIGPEGSGSRALSVSLLQQDGVVDQKSATLLPFTPAEAIQKLQHNELDAAVFLDAWESPIIRQLFAMKDLHIASVRRADAFVALHASLNKLVLPAGAADLAENVPPADVQLLAPKASMVVRRDLHPAIQYLLLDAAQEIESVPGMFHKPGEFPAPESIDLPLSSHARQFYRTGSPYLQRHLPFWLAVFIQQLLVLAVPLFGVLYPLLRFAPYIYQWAGHRRIYGLYLELKDLEDQLAAAPAAESLNDVIHNLDHLEERVRSQPVAASARPHLYWLRLHIRMVRERVARNTAAH
jgi:TRAP-type uncharacterized transport system substrate-binding protein